jgi:hypothetical protein
MDGNLADIRELTLEEAALVGGAWTWEGIAGAMITGAIVGGMAGAVPGGVTAPVGAISGALLGAAGYLINDMVQQYVF